MPKSRRTLLKSIGLYALLAVLSAFSLGPILWGLATSFKPTTVINAYPPVWIPSPVTTEHYLRVIFGSNMLLYYRNSIIVFAGTVLISILVASHAAYASDRFEFRGKNAMLLGILCTMMIPSIAILVPLYMLVSSVGLNDTLLAMILIYSASLVPTCLWIMRGFFAAVPKSLDEAAMIDGCSRFQVFYRIVLPLTWPGISAVALVVFRFTWNEYIIATTISASDGTRTIPVGLYYFIAAFGIEWGVLMAAVMLALVPAVILFIFMQRKFVDGMTSGAVKG
jgi:ABC-type glycerol-3-phosphate transport system permease component